MTSRRINNIINSPQSMINKEKWDRLEELMMKLSINEADLIEKFILGSGKGGRSCIKLPQLFI